MMNHATGWMGGGSGGAMWIPWVIGIAVAVLLVVVIGRMTKK